ncbi:MAG: hypothetical protein HY645_05770 [Acidobacteria bacterium]|nr:hypothetical protein [Acidobacteriota bacterium]
MQTVLEIAVDYRRGILITLLAGHPNRVNGVPDWLLSSAVNRGESRKRRLLDDHNI